MTIKTSIFFLFFLSFTIFACAQEVSKPDSIDVFLQSKMQRLHIPALQVAVVRGGKIVKNKTYGIANLENNIPANNQTIFSVNSITKAFTGIAIMQLAEEG